MDFVGQRDALRRRINERGMKPPREPLKLVNSDLVALFGEMVREDRFSVTALVGFEEPFKTCALAWLHRAKPYQTVGPRSVAVTLQNVSGEPLRVNHRAEERQVYIQALGRHGSHTHTYQKVVAPGETIELESTWAVHAIWKHGGMFRPSLEAEFEPELAPRGKLVEVGGELVLDGQRFRWPAPAPAPEDEAEPAKGRPRRSVSGHVPAEG